MSEPHALYIVKLDFERDAWHGHAVRGLRALWDALDTDNDRTYREARDMISGFAENPMEAVLVATAEDLDLIGNAVAKALELSESVITFAMDLESTELEAPEGLLDDDEDALADVFSPAAYKTALVHLAYANGNPTLAYHRTFSMQKATEDATLWEEVRDVLTAAFTHDGEDPPEQGGGPPIVWVQ